MYVRCSDDSMISKNTSAKYTLPNELEVEHFTVYFKTSDRFTCAVQFKLCSFSTFATVSSTKGELAI